MSKTQSVLVSVSIVVTAPVGDMSEDDVTDRVQEAFLEAVAARLSSGVEALKSEPWFERDAGSAYHYLSSDADSPFAWSVEKNVGRCTRCGTWTSDFDAPQHLDLLMRGKKVKENLYCIECWFELDLP